MGNGHPQRARVSKQPLFARGIIASQNRITNLSQEGTRERAWQTLVNLRFVEVMAEKQRSEQEVEQAFEDLESAFEELMKVLGGELALGSLFMVDKALAIVQSTRLNYARHREFELPLPD